jgi:hypothetical protein
MNPHATVLVWIHYLAAGLIGPPAFCGTLFFGWQIFQLVRHPTPPLPEVRSSQDGLLQIFTAVERGLAMVTQPLAILGEAVFKFLFLISASALVFAVLAYGIGRGLSGGALWARLLCGCVFSALILIGGLAVLTGDMDGVRPVGAVVLALGGYGIWILVTGFQLG